MTVAAFRVYDLPWTPAPPAVPDRVVEFLLERPAGALGSARGIA
jgi:hypothetical protein